MTAISTAAPTRNRSTYWLTAVALVFATIALTVYVVGRVNSSDTNTVTPGSKAPVQTSQHNQLCAPRPALATADHTLPIDKELAMNHPQLTAMIATQHSRELHDRADRARRGKQDPHGIRVVRSVHTPPAPRVGAWKKIASAVARTATVTPAAKPRLA
jgi:hypothetical protein